MNNILKSLKIYLAGVRFVVGKSTAKHVKTFIFALADFNDKSNY